MSAIILTNSLDQVEPLTAYVSQACQAAGMSPDDTGMTILAMEELVVNVINYAYPEGQSGDISVEATTSDGCLIFTIIDQGTPFDPTKADEADTTLSAEERPIGGLGIHLARQILDSMTYQRKADSNILTVGKRVKAE